VHGQAPVLAGSSPKPWAPNQPFNVKVAVSPQFKGRVLVKVIASEKPLDVAAFNKLSANQRTNALLAALQKNYPAPGGSREFVGTQGWSDQSAWFEFK